MQYVTFVKKKKTFRFHPKIELPSSQLFLRTPACPIPPQLSFLIEWLAPRPFPFLTAPLFPYFSTFNSISKHTATTVRSIVQNTLSQEEDILSVGHKITQTDGADAVFDLKCLWNWTLTLICDWEISAFSCFNIQFLNCFSEYEVEDLSIVWNFLCTVKYMQHMLFLFVFHNSCSELYKFTKQILLKLSPRLIVPNCFYHTYCKICSWSHVYFQYQNL